MHGNQNHNYDKHMAYALVALVAVLAIALMVTAFALYNSEHAIAVLSQEPHGYASIALLIIPSQYMTSSMKITLNGSGYSTTVPVSLGIATYGIGGEVTGPVLPNETLQVPNYTRYKLLFTGLKPQTKYTITVNGSSSPYCFPGLACAMFIVKIYKVFNITTGPNGSTINITLNNLGITSNTTNVIANSSLASYAPCTQSYITENNSTTAVCSPDQRLYNFALKSINRNGTITIYSYRYIPAMLNQTNAIAEVIKKGEVAGFLCSGLFAYYENSSYANQLAFFKIVKTRPIPCPVA